MNINKNIQNTYRNVGVFIMYKKGGILMAVARFVDLLNGNR